MRDSVAIPITEPSQAGEARRIAIAMASHLDFNETERGKVAIVVTEAAKNLVQHATNGELLLRALERNHIGGIEVLALDKGPGIVNISECMRDGFSTAGTPGTGLGAIVRLSNFFDIHSVSGVGTALLARLWSRPLPMGQPAAGLEVGVVCLPKVGEEACGDAWTTEQYSDRNLILVADGLGHGPGAAEASLKAVKICQENASLTPKEIIEAAHTGLRNTRGAAIAVVKVDLEQQSVCFAGVGNIASAIVSSERSYSMVSHNGTVGHEVRKIQEFIYPWSKGALLVMHSDGLATQWRLDRYVGLVMRHPSLIAGVLYRDFNRSRDDVTVVVAREVRKEDSLP
jgi:anti-sigma regulatory factor (Ser/Thr protein kinase)